MHVVVCCSMLQCIAVRGSDTHMHVGMDMDTKIVISVCCSLLQSVAVCCSLLQGVAGRCSNTHTHTGIRMEERKVREVLEACVLSDQEMLAELPGLVWPLLTVCVYERERERERERYVTRCRILSGLSCWCVWEREGGGGRDRESHVTRINDW